MLQDFEISGVFEAQSHLEQRHTEEEERLQRFISEEREKELHRLNEGINAEKERAAAELLASMDQMSLQRNSRDLFAERERIEDHFRRAQEDRLRIVMDRVASEEKSRTGKMVERHGQEMMLLIAEKVKHDVFIALMFVYILPSLWFLYQFLLIVKIYTYIIIFL